MSRYDSTWSGSLKNMSESDRVFFNTGNRLRSHRWENEFGTFRCKQTPLRELTLAIIGGRPEHVLF